MGTFIDTSGILAGTQATAASVRALFDGLDAALAGVADGSVAITPDINGGAIDGAVIGGTTRAAGSFTTLAANAQISNSKALAPSSAINLTTLAASDAKYILYNSSAANWAGMGVNTSGHFWLRTGVSAGAGLVLESDGDLLVSKGVTAGGHLTTGGDLVISTGAADAHGYMNANVQKFREFQFQTAGSPRWAFGTDAAAESGGGAGTNFKITRWGDGSGPFDTVKFRRADGLVRFESNVTLGADNAGTSATRTLVIADGTPPGSSPANVVQVFADTVTGTVELRVRDSAGNVSTQSPHNPQMVDASGRPTDYVHKEHNPYTGRDIEIDIYGALVWAQQQAGETFIHVRDLPPGKRENPFLRKLVNRRAQIRSRMHG